MKIPVDENYKQSFKVTKKLYGGVNAKDVKKLEQIAWLVEQNEAKFEGLSDEELANQTNLFKQRLQKGETLDDLLPEAFAVCREASKRVLHMRHYFVQIMGGIALHQGRIAQLATGEGKTLMETLPAYLNALSGNGVHIVTVNEYLAQRDAQWMGDVFRFLGLSVGVTLAQMDFHAKQKAYACDITYGTNSEFGFDYLRDNMATDRRNCVQRGLNFVIVDEVDSILIDEARTPLIISGPSGKSGDMYIKANKFVCLLKNSGNVDDEGQPLNEEEEPNGDYVVDNKDRTARLTDKGIASAEKYFGLENLSDEDNAELNHYINNALRAHAIMHRGEDYIVERGQVIIVDSFTGRKMEGRRFSNGLHQAIEAKEHVIIREENKTYATITLQNYFRLYRKLSGMTGTAKTEEKEFNTIYNIDVVAIPTHLPMIREDRHDLIFPTRQGKLRAIVREIKERHEKGQPLLIGTVTVEKSKELSQMLTAEKISHNVLNAESNKSAFEAEIIAQAGRFGAVTIATNMAGRGTDILLGGGDSQLVARALAKSELKQSGKEFRSVYFKNYIDGCELSLQDKEMLNAINSVFNVCAIRALILYADAGISHEADLMTQCVKSVEGNSVEELNANLILALKQYISRVTASYVQKHFEPDMNDVLDHYYAEDSDFVGYADEYKQVLRGLKHSNIEEWVTVVCRHGSQADLKFDAENAVKLFFNMQKFLSRLKKALSGSYSPADLQSADFVEIVSNAIAAAFCDEQQHTLLQALDNYLKNTIASPRKKKLESYVDKTLDDYLDRVLNFTIDNDGMQEQYRKLVEKKTAELEAKKNEERQKVLDVGGLCVIGTERHDARRIDNQLRGRAGRQGDPGCSVFFVSAEDDMIRIFNGDLMQRTMAMLRIDDDTPMQGKMLNKVIESAQRRIEGRHYSARKNVLQYDDVNNRQRKIIYGERDRILKGEDIHKELTSLVETYVRSKLAEVCGHEYGILDWDIKKENVLRWDLAQVNKTFFDCFPEQLITPEVENISEIKDILLNYSRSVLENQSAFDFEEQNLLDDFKQKVLSWYNKANPHSNLNATRVVQTQFDADLMLEEYAKFAVSLLPRYKTDWDLDKLNNTVWELYPRTPIVTENAAISASEVLRILVDYGVHALQVRKNFFESEDYRPSEDFKFDELARNILLQSVDSLWMDHIDALEDLQQGVGLRSIGQYDPLMVYKKEAYDMFEKLEIQIATKTIRMLLFGRPVNRSFVNFGRIVKPYDIFDFADERYFGKHGGKQKSVEGTTNPTNAPATNAPMTKKEEYALKRQQRKANKK